VNPLLQASQISVRFGGVIAVSEADYHVDGPGVFGIAGPNGSGKTTLLNVISRVQRPVSGRLLFDGIDYTHWPTHKIATLGITRTFQNVRLVPTLTVLENVMVGLHHLTKESGILASWLQMPSAHRRERAARERALALLSELGLENAAHRRPQELPYGFQRRVELARALAAEPRLMLLDEPTAGMPRADVEVIAELVNSVSTRRHMAIVLVEHNVPLLAQLCSHLVVMLAGRILAKGTPDNVLSDPRVIEAYLGKLRHRVSPKAIN